MLEVISSSQQDNIDYINYVMHACQLYAVFYVYVYYNYYVTFWGEKSKIFMRIIGFFMSLK